MLKILLTVAFLILICTGIGIELLNKLNLKKLTFSAPIGLVLLLTALQVLYYPAQFLNLSFNWIIITSIIVILIGCFFTIKNWRLIVKEFFNFNTIFIIASFTIFFVVFYFSFIDLEFSDSPMYLNYIAQNINIERLNMFHLYTGLNGAEWDGLYLFQGLYHFASFLCWLINVPFYLLGSANYVENITISTYGLGSIYSIISSMFFVSMINSLDIKNKISKFSIIIFTLFFSNFYYWRVIFSYYGNTFRTLFITMLIYFIYKWLKDNKENNRIIIGLILFAGLACSSSFLFISFSVMFALTMYLFLNKRENAFIDLSLMVFPIVLYSTIMFSRSNQLIACILLVSASIYYLGLYLGFINNIVTIIQSFIFKYAKAIFLIIIPLFLIIFSAYINLFKPEYLYNFNYYFQDHQAYDMVKDYTFRYSTWLDNILNFGRWLAIILLFLKTDKKQYQWVKFLILVTIFIFLNPLMTTAISYLIASNVFYRTVEVLFNPFTETIMIIVLLNTFNNKFGRTIIQSFLIIAVIVGQFLSILGHPNSLYGFYFERGKNVLPFYKIDWAEYEIIKAFQDEIYENHDQSNQLRVISQAEGLRTFTPNVYQLFTARDYFYPYTRLNSEFYEIARKHHSWETYPDTDYSKACNYINEYQVDYLIIKYWENVEFDQATDKCSITLYESAVYKLKEVKK